MNILLKKCIFELINMNLESGIWNNNVITL